MLQKRATEPDQLTDVFAPPSLSLLPLLLPPRIRGKKYLHTLVRQRMLYHNNNSTCKTKGIDSVHPCKHTYSQAASGNKKNEKIEKADWISPLYRTKTERIGYGDAGWQTCCFSPLLSAQAFISLAQCYRTRCTFGSDVWV